MNEKDKVREGEKARQLLKDPMMAKCIMDMRNFWVSEIQGSKARETRKREECYRMLKCVDQFESTLRRRIESGKVAQSRLEQAKTKIERLIRTEY